MKPNALQLCVPYCTGIPAPNQQTCQINKGKCTPATPILLKPCKAVLRPAQPILHPSKQALTTCRLLQNGTSCCPAEAKHDKSGLLICKQGVQTTDTCWEKLWHSRSSLESIARMHSQGSEHTQQAPASLVWISLQCTGTCPLQHPQVHAPYDGQAGTTYIMAVTHCVTRMMVPPAQ